MRTPVAFVAVLLAISACEGRVEEGPTDAGFACADAFECNVDAIALSDGDCDNESCADGDVCLRGGTLATCIEDTTEPQCEGGSVVITGESRRVCGDPAIACVDGECAGPGFDQ